MFRLGFGFLSVLVVDWLTGDRVSSDRLDRSDPFTRAAINYALSGSHRRGLKLLEEVEELFNTNVNSDMPCRFYKYIQNNEKDLVTYLTKKHPMAVLPDEDYYLIMEDVKFFISNYEMFKDVKKLLEDVVSSREEMTLINTLHPIFARLKLNRNQ